MGIRTMVVVAGQGAPNYPFLLSHYITLGWHEIKAQQDFTPETWEN
jgi:hypothetical protein